MSKAFSVRAPARAWLAMLSAASKVATKGRPIPALEHVLIDAPAVGVQPAWWATDGLLWRAGRLDADVEQPGSVLLPVGHLLALVRRCGEAPLEIAMGSDDAHAMLRSGSFTSRIPIWNVTDYPVRPSLGSGGLRVSAAALHAALRHATCAVDPLSDRRHIRGCVVTFAEGRLRAAGTDGYRLGARTCVLDENGLGAHETVTVPVPAAATAVLLEMVDGAESVSYREVDGRQVWLAGEALLVCSPLEGQYEPVDKLLSRLPRESLGSVSRADLIEAVGRAMVSLSGTGPRRVDVSVDAARVVVTGRSVERGESVDCVPIDGCTRAAQFGVRGQHLLSCLQALVGDQVSLTLSDRHAIVLEPSPAPEGESVFVVAQMAMD